jgi:hypothetical protein
MARIVNNNNKLINIFKKGLNKTASYIYSRDPNTGIFYFAFGRKIPFGARKRLDKKNNSGAAGTKKIYHGKWCSFGGNVKKCKHMLDASIKEIRDEANVRNLNSYNVDVIWLSKRNLNALLTLHYAENVNNVAVFIYEIKNFNIFKSIFPIFPLALGGAELVNSSKGEIDIVASFSTDMLNNMQSSEMRSFNNNFMTSYVINTFNNVVIPFISRISNAYLNKWNNKKINFLNDIKFRKTYPMPNYNEISNNKYI